MDNELFEQAFDGELRAEDIQALREALQKRMVQLQAAQQRGELVDADWTDASRLSELLSVLREEELIAEFVEDGLTASLRRAEMLKQLGEGDEAEG